MAMLLFQSQSHRPPMRPLCVPLRGSFLGITFKTAQHGLDHGHLVPSVKAHALSASVLVLLELMVAAREMSK